MKPSELEGGGVDKLTFYPVINKDSLEMDLQDVIIRCPELAELKLPNSKFIGPNDFPSNSCMIHIPERLYFQYKDYEHLTVYVKPRTSYYHLENFMPNIIIREGIGSSYEQVQGKSNRIRVERLKEEPIPSEDQINETSSTSNTSTSDDEDVHDKDVQEKSISEQTSDRSDYFQASLSIENMMELNFPYITGGECFKYTIFISKAIPHHEHLSKLFKEDGHLVIEFSGNDIPERKTDQYHTMMVLTFDELDYWWNRENVVLYYVISKPGTTYPYSFYYPCLEYEESKDEEHYIKYGTNAKSIYYFKGKSVEKAYEWFYHSNCGLFNSTNLDPTYGQLLECVSWLYLYRWKELNEALSEIANRNKKDVRSIDIKPISFGMYNATYDISAIEASSILRIAFNSTDFDSNACRILMHLKDSGFVPVHYYNPKLRYSVLAKCTSIDKFNIDKLHSMMDKIRSTIQAEPSLCLSDFHKGNVMELNDEYVYIDIDLNGIDAEKIMKLYGSKTIDEIMDNEIPTDSYVKPYTIPILKSCSIPITNHTISLCALELAYISNCSGKLKYTSEVHSEITSRLKEDMSREKSNGIRKFQRGGSVKKVIIVDNDLDNKEWWINKCKETGLKYYISNEVENSAEKLNKDQTISYYFMCKWDNRIKFQDAGFRYQFLFTDKEVEDEPHVFSYWEYPVIEKVKEGMVSVYGKNIPQYYKVNNPYEFVFNRFIIPHQNEFIFGPSSALFNFYLDQFEMNDYHKINWILCKYCQKRNIIRTSDDVKCIGNGHFNVALNIDDDVIRIHVNYEVPFDRKGAEALMKEKNTGFVPVKKVGEDYTIVPLCKSLDKHDKIKAKNLLIKVRWFFKKHQDLSYVDYHWGNIMELNGEYVITDIDLNMITPELFQMQHKPLKELIGSEQKTGWNIKLYLSLLDQLKTKPSLYIITMLAIELFESADYQTSFILTQDIIDEIFKRMKPITHIDEEMDRKEISTSNPSLNSSSIFTENSSLEGGNKSRFKYIEIRSRPYLIIYIHGGNPHGIKFHRSTTETIRLYCQSTDYSFGYYLRGRENELTDQDIDRIELKPFSMSYDDEKASIPKQSQVKLNSIAYNDVYDLDQEFKLFDKALHDEFKDVLKLKDLKIYLLGHSYGACFSKYFAMKLKDKLNVTSISLDGSDLYSVAALFITEYINGEYVNNIDEVKIKTEEIKFGPKEIIYEGINYYGNAEAGLPAPYCDVMYMLKDDYDKHIIIEYNANPKDPNKAKLIKLNSKYYKNQYELEFGPIYSHSLHMHYACVQAIFNRFIECNWCLYRGILDDVRDKHQDQVHYIIKRMNGDDLTIIIQGENDHNEHPPQTFEWNDIKYYTLALFEQKNTFYPCYFYLEPDHRPTAQEKWTEPWFPYTWNYWDKHRDMLKGVFKTNDGQAKGIKECLIDYPKCPRLIDFKPCDYRNSACRNPIFSWLLISLEPNLLEKHMSGDEVIPSSYKTSIEELKASGFHNEKLSDDIYKRLINDWSWKDVNGLIKLRHKLLNMNLLDIFNLVIFNFSEYKDGKPLGDETVYPLCFNTKAFFISKFPYSTNFITDIFNDIPMLNELEHEITSGEHKLVIIYGGSGHMRTYMKFMSLYYEQNCDANVNQDIIDEYLRERLGKK